jgi:hypothetical protein
VVAPHIATAAAGRKSRFRSLTTERLRAPWEPQPKTGVPVVGHVTTVSRSNARMGRSGMTPPTGLFSPVRLSRSGLSFSSAAQHTWGAIIGEGGADRLPTGRVTKPRKLELIWMKPTLKYFSATLKVTALAPPSFGHSFVCNWAKQRRRHASVYNRYSNRGARCSVFSGSGFRGEYQRRPAPTEWQMLAR